MKLEFKNNFRGYFLFYYNVVGNKLLVNLGLCVIVSFLDGIGLAMFMPLLQAVGTKKASSGKQTMGQLHYITDFIEKMGFSLTINTVLVMLVVLFGLKGIIKFLQANYQVNLRHLFMKNIRHVMVDRLQDLTFSGFLKLDAGRIQNTLIAESQRLFTTMNYYFNAAQSAIMLFTYIVLAFLANYQFALLVALGAGLTNFIYRNIYIATKKASLEVSKKGNDFNSLLIQAILYFKYLKSTDYFSSFSRRLKYVINHTEELNRKMGFYAAITTGVREPIIVGIVALVIYFQVNWLGASVASILLSLLLFYRSLSFLMVIQNYWQSFIQNIGSMDSVTRLTIEMGEIQEVHKTELFPGINEGLHISNVSLSYGTNQIFKGINLDIPKNKTIALVGESGSGKTTLANIIVGLIPPDEGALLIDDVDVNEYNLNSYRSRVGYISQEPVIFNDDIFNNITFWAEPTPENVQHFWDTIELASLTDFVRSQPLKEKTQLGDNGILISGGQKQRISIARELYKTAEILVLDEATSSLDSETERIIQDNIEKLHGKYTMIIIAHRLSTIRDADTIYLLERGEISASGTFSKMIEESARFKHMVNLQEFS